MSLFILRQAPIRLTLILTLLFASSSPGAIRPDNYRPVARVETAARISADSAQVIWFDDDLPAGAVKHAEGERDWYWVSANPGSFSGTKSHQSENFGQLDPSKAFHRHYFDGAASRLPVDPGDTVFTYVFLDIDSMPREIMLEFKDTENWEHRAYWGQNNINVGTDGTNSRWYMGPLPKAGSWVRLEVPASAIDLEGTALNGMSFDLDGGRATWDLAGKAPAGTTAPPATQPGDTVWIEDSLPAGAQTSVVNDVWNWVANPHYSGALAHQSFVSVNPNSTIYRSHSFIHAQTPLAINPGDVLFTYVYLSAAAKPDQIMLQWNDGTSWEHRAFWSNVYLGSQFPNTGTWGTEGQRYMGGLPDVGNWYRLEVPASYVGLEGKSVSGMAFGCYGKEPTVTWDRSGKSAQMSSVPLRLASTTGVFRLFDSDFGYAFETNDLATQKHAVQKSNVFFAFSNQAAGTVPMYRFRRSTSYEYFYSQCRACYEKNGWDYYGVAFYLFPNSSAQGTVPLYLYHDSQFHYFLTIDQHEAAAMTLDGISGYVYANQPARPLLSVSPPCANLSWTFESSGSGFEIEKMHPWESGWTTLASVGPTVRSYPAECMSQTQAETSALAGVWSTYYRVRANNSAGEWTYSNDAIYHSCPQRGLCPQADDSLPNQAPEITISSPADGARVSRGLMLTANAFDVEGNGSIAKVEFFANDIRVAEITSAPYMFFWTNVQPGLYSVTATATDLAGAKTTSAPITIMVDQPARRPAPTPPPSLRLRRGIM